VVGHASMVGLTGDATVERHGGDEVRCDRIPTLTTFWACRLQLLFKNISAVDWAMMIRRLSQDFRQNRCEDCGILDIKAASLCPLALSISVTQPTQSLNGPCSAGTEQLRLIQMAGRDRGKGVQEKQPKTAPPKVRGRQPRSRVNNTPNIELGTRTSMQWIHRQTISVLLLCYPSP
jgi:hypothetical protein